MDVGGQLMTTGPLHLVRQAGAPVSTLTDLPDTAPALLLDRVDALDAELAVTAASLADRLHPIIGRQQDPAMRRRLLALRRAVFNRRLPAAGARPDAVAGGLSSEPALLTDLRRWQATVIVRQNLSAQARQALAGDHGAALVWLRRAWRDPGFRCGVAFAQAQLYHDLDTAMHAGIASRRLIEAAVSYRCRMATKASPFSSFASLGQSARENPQDHHTVYLDPALLSRIAEAGTAQVAAHLPLRPATGVQQSADTLTVLRVRGAHQTRPDETLVTIDRTPTVDVIWALVRAEPDRHTPTALAARLASLTAVPEQSWARGISQLTAHGLLEPAGWFDAGHPDALEQLATGPCHTRAAAVTRLADSVRAADPDDPESVATALSTAHRVVTELIGDRAPSRRPATLLRHHRYHRGGSPPDLGDLRRQLGPLTPLAMLFAPPTRTPMGQAQDRPVLAAFLAQPDPPTPDHRLPAQTLVASELRRLTATDAAQVRLDPQTLNRWREAAAEHAAAGPIAWLVQPLSDGSFVVNDAVPGHATLLACHLSGHDDGALTAAVARRLAALAPEAEVVELRGTFGFGGQVRPDVTPRRLVYPGEPHRPDPDRDLDWDDLVVTGDPVQLWDRRTSRRIAPVHLGSLAPVFLPPLYRFLMAFGPNIIPLWDPLGVVAPGPDEAVAPGVGAYPRVVHDGLVLLRRTWTVPHSQMPARQDRDDLADYRRVRAWAGALGLPRRFWVTAIRGDDPAAAELPAHHLRRLRKPWYVDLDRSWSYRLFRRATRSTGAVVAISEALPDLDAVARSGGRVTEFLVDVDG